MTPIWLTVLVALVSAFGAVGLRALWEEWRDFRAARRVVASELRSNGLAVTEWAHAVEAGRNVPDPAAVRDSGYRSVQLVLARYLPPKLWNFIDGIYRDRPRPDVKAYEAYFDLAEELDAMGFIRSLFGLSRTRWDHPEPPEPHVMVVKVRRRPPGSSEGSGSSEGGSGREGEGV